MMGYSLYRKGMVTKKDLKNKKIQLIFFICGIIYTIAWIIVNYSISAGFVSIVTPISSLSPAVIVILAVIFYKEKLVLNQKIGILTILSGLFLISL